MSKFHNNAACLHRNLLSWQHHIICAYPRPNLMEYIIKDVLMPFDVNWNQSQTFKLDEKFKFIFNQQYKQHSFIRRKMKMCCLLPKISKCMKFCKYFSIILIFNQQYKQKFNFQKNLIRIMKLIDLYLDFDRKAHLFCFMWLWVICIQSVIIFLISHW